MNRYHKKIYFPESDKTRLVDLCEKLNGKAYIITPHCIERVKENLKALDGILRHIKEYTIQYNNIFEYYENHGIIERIVIRINYNEYRDLILVIGNRKELITIYFNDIKDNHITLREELYTKKAV